MKHGLLWGCGLGDWIVVFPVIKYVTESLGHELYYFTKDSHIKHIFLDYQARNPNFHVIFIPKGLRAIPVLARYWLRLDRVVALFEPGKDMNRALGFALLPRDIHFLRMDDQWIAEQLLQLFPDARHYRLYNADTLSFCLPDAARFSAPLEAYVLIHPFARADWQSKQWPFDSWCALIEWIVKEHRLRVLIAGDGVDMELAERMLEQLSMSAKAGVDVALGKALSEVVELSRHARIAVCHNSGLMHIFAQTGTETVVINGSSAQCWLRPEPWVHNIDSGLCQLKCNSRQCILPERDARCVTGLSLDRVKSLVDEILQKTSAGRGGQVPLLPDS